MKDYPRAVFRKLLPRIVVYQGLWLLFAVSRGGFSAYLKGLRGAVGGRKSMKAKHLDLMAKRRLDDSQLLALMQMSERRVFDWQRARPASERSSLLSLYFRIFPPRAS